jgi:hypothetical protein
MSYPWHQHDSNQHVSLALGTHSSSATVSNPCKATGWATDLSSPYTCINQSSKFNQIKWAREMEWSSVRSDEALVLLAAGGRSRRGEWIKGWGERKELELIRASMAGGVRRFWVFRRRWGTPDSSSMQDAWCSMGQDDGARRGASEFHVLENSHGRRHRAREGWNSKFFFIFKDLQKYTFISKFCKTIPIPPFGQRGPSQPSFRMAVGSYHRLKR